MQACLRLLERNREGFAKEVPFRLRISRWLRGAQSGEWHMQRHWGLRKLGLWGTSKWLHIAKV